MKKIIFTFCLASLFGTFTRAEVTRMNGNNLSFGVGFGWIHKESTGSGSANFPSPHVRYERGVHTFENIGVLTVGGQFGFHSSYHNGTFLGTEATMQYRQSWTSFYLMPTATLYFHEVFRNMWNLDQNVEIYFGVGLGVRYIHHRISDGPVPPTILPEAEQPWLGWNVFLGGRYAFNQNFAVFAEFGWGLSIFNVGATIAF